MKKFLKIAPTEEDVARGVRKNARQCAIQRWIARDNPDFIFPTVGRETIAVSSRQFDLRYTWATPIPVRRFISAFDKGKALPELSCTLPLDQAEVSHRLHETPEQSERRRALRADPSRPVEPRKSRRRDH